jgi:hypothetical protein
MRKEDCHKTIWIHMLDPNNRFNTKKAKKSCRHCYGTGVAGKLHLYDTKLICACVVRKTAEDEAILTK